MVRLAILTLTGLEGHICPSLVKGLEGHICHSVVTSWWRHCEHHELGGAKINITLWSEGHVLLQYGE